MWNPFRSGEPIVKIAIDNSGTPEVWKIRESMVPSAASQIADIGATVLAVSPSSEYDHVTARVHYITTTKPQQS